MYIVMSLSPMVQVASNKTESGTMSMRTIVLRELGGQWTNTYAAKVFGTKAKENYVPGQVVGASLRFRVSSSLTSGQTFQDVVAEEIVTFNSINQDDIL